jgi:hypothetical protein
MDKITNIMILFLLILKINGNDLLIVTVIPDYFIIVPVI